MLSYKFVNGIAILKTLHDMPNYTPTIPQPDGDDVAVELKDTQKASQVLGIILGVHNIPSVDHVL